MSLNYAFTFSLFLLILVSLNIYFFYVLNSVTKKSSFKVPNIVSKKEPDFIKEIYEYLSNLPLGYKNKNPQFLPLKNRLVDSFNYSQNVNNNVWKNITQWTENGSLFPNKQKMPGQILQAMRYSQIVFADNAPKGTQLKLLFMLQGKHKMYFKPKRYKLEDLINGNIYAGYDRHNSEVFGYYLAVIMNFTWVAPSVIRKVNVKQEIIPVMTSGLKETTIKYGNGLLCVYGKCFYCKVNETVCSDENGEIEGAAILFLDKQFKMYKSPWRHSYSKNKMEWEKDNNYCKKIKAEFSLTRLLDLIDISIFDFLIQNGDRHHYEVYKGKILLLDNGKGLGNPWVDEFDILAPLYQCCMIRYSTWRHLEWLSGGSLSETIKLLASIQGEKLATEDHMKAVERRLLKVYATIHFCVGKYGKTKVLRKLQ